MPRGPVEAERRPGPVTVGRQRRYLPRLARRYPRAGPCTAPGARVSGYMAAASRRAPAPAMRAGTRGTGRPRQARTMGRGDTWTLPARASRPGTAALHCAAQHHLNCTACTACTARTSAACTAPAVVAAAAVDVAASIRAQPEPLPSRPGVPRPACRSPSPRPAVGLATARRRGPVAGALAPPCLASALPRCRMAGRHTSPGRAAWRT